MKKIVFFALLVALSFSCEQEEEPVVDTRPDTNNPTQPVPTVPDTTDVPGDTVPNNGGGDGVEPSKPIEIDRYIKSVSLSFEVGYANQIFFDLERGQLISEIEKDIYEFIFETSLNGNHVKLNSSLYIGAAYIPNKSFEEVSFTESVEWKYDNPDGDLDKLAIDLSKDGVYLVLGGYAVDGGQNPNIKLEVTASGSSYEVKCQKDGGSITRYTVAKDGTPWTAVGVESGVKNIYPQSYDILFSHYTHIYDDGTTYLVTGGLTNTAEGITVATLTQEDFASITIEDLGALTYTEDADAIGFEWKSYSLDTHTYTMQPEKVHIINKEDKYFKLRFVGFNKNVLGGRYMIFEYARL